MKLYEIAFASYVYGQLENFDKSYDNLRKATIPRIDLTSSGHRKEILVWLNKWGCRQFHKKQHCYASEKLKVWYHEVELPGIDKSIVNATSDVLAQIEKAYETLTKTNAVPAKANDGKAAVSWGPTGAAKTLFALRPELCVPWDQKIRAGKYGDSATSYIQFLQDCRRDLTVLQADMKERGLDVSQLARLIGREDASLAKLVDEFNWVTKTRAIKVPSQEVLSRWAQWMLPARKIKGAKEQMSMDPTRELKGPRSNF